MKTKVLYLLLVLVLPLTSELQAQSRESVLNLEQCISLAKERNLGLKEEQLKLRQAKLSHSSSLNAFLPRASANVGQNFSFGRSQDKRGVYVDRSSSATNFGISASLELFSGLRRLNNRKATGLNLKAKEFGFAEAKENLELQVTQLYFLWLYRHYAYEASKAQTERFKAQYKLAEGMVKVGKWSRDKLLEAKTSVAQAQDNELSLFNELTLAKLDLCQAIEQDIEDTSFELKALDDELLLASAQELEEEGDIYTQALDKRPTFQRSRLEIEASKLAIASARSGYYPSLSLNLGYGNSYYYLMEKQYRAFNQPFSEQWKQNGRSYIGLSLNIPLFDAFRTRNQIRSAKLDFQFRQLAYQKQCKLVRKEVAGAKMNLKLAKGKMKSSEISWQLNEDLAKLMEEKLRLGKATQLEYRQAVQNEFVAKQNYLKAQIDYCLKARLLHFYKREAEPLSFP